MFVRGAALAGGAAAASLAIDTGCARTEASSGPSAPLIVAADGNAVVETTAGKVRGFTRNGIQTFKGIPYAATTEGSGSPLTRQTQILGRYSQFHVLRSDLPTSPTKRLAQRWRTRFVSVGRRAARRRLPAHESVDPRTQRRQEATGDGVAARGRLDSGFRTGTACLQWRESEPGAAMLWCSV